MKTRISFSNASAAAVVLLGIIAATITTWNTPQAKALSQHVEPLAFGMFGITHGQTARLNVVDTSVINSDVPPGPCRAVELMFIDAGGNVRGRSVECLMPSRAAFLDLNGSFLEMSSLHIEIRAKVQVLEPDRNGHPFNLVSTVEVFDNETGKTSFVMSHPKKGDDSKVDNPAD